MQLAWLVLPALAILLSLGCDASGLRPDRLPQGHELLASPVAIPKWWLGRADQVGAFVEQQVKRGKARKLCRSPGGRPVYAVFYGRAEPRLRGPANFNSAMAAADPNAYFRRGERQRPVMVILAGVHGQEMEGCVAALSVVSIMETGRDLRRQPQPALREKLDRLRLIVIPMANPDGRARVPYDGWVGLPTREMTRFGQGTRRDGALYGWPGAKAVHPMRGDVGILGGYFDDEGVNLMHDEWPNPMSRTTKALLGLAAREGPDLLLNLHSHASPPAVLQAAYVPAATKQRILSFARSCYAKFEAAEVPHGALPKPAADGPPGKVPPALNLTSMFYHVGVTLPVTFEGPHGVKDGREPFDYPGILDLHHALFGAAAEWVCRGRRKP